MASASPTPPAAAMGGEPQIGAEHAVAGDVDASPKGEQETGLTRPTVKDAQAVVSGRDPLATDADIDWSCEPAQQRLQGWGDRSAWPARRVDRRGEQFPRARRARARRAPLRRDRRAPDDARA